MKLPSRAYHRIFGVPVWLLPLLLLPLAFSAWSIGLMVSVSRLRASVERDVATTGRLAQFTRVVRDFQSLQPRSAAAGDASQGSWTALRDVSVQAATTLADEALIAPQLARTNTLIDAFGTELAAPGPGDLMAEVARLRRIDNAIIDELNAATLAVRRRLTEVSVDLGRKWTQLNLLAGISVALALCVALLLVVSERTAADRLRLLDDLNARQQEIGQLRGILPICSYCKRIRDDTQYWERLEVYSSQHADVVFSHGVCPECFDTVLSGEGGDNPASAGS